MQQMRKEGKQLSAADQAKLDKWEAARNAQSAKQAAAQMEIDRQNQKKEDIRVAKLAREQATRDAATARLAAEQAKRQAEIDKKQQKVTSDAEARVKAAEAAYREDDRLRVDVLDIESFTGRELGEDSRQNALAAGNNSVLGS